MVDKWSIKPTLAGKLADIIEFMADKEEIKTESNVYRRYPSVSSTTAKCVLYGTRRYPNGGIPFRMSWACSTTKTIIPRTATIGSI